MPQIINPFRPQNTPLAQAITQVGKDIYGDQLTPALKREQLIAAQRGNVETDALAQSFADPAGGVDYQAMILSGYKPSDAADARLMQQAEAFGARAPQTQSAQIGAGQGYDNTADAFGTKIATERRGQDIASSDRRFGFNLNDSTERWKFSNTPEEAMVNGAAAFVPRSGVFAPGVQPILSQSELGPAAEFNQWYDFYKSRNIPDAEAESLSRRQIEKSQNSRRTTVNAEGGVTIEEGEVGDLTNAAMSEAQRGRLAAAKFRAAADRAIKLTETDPTLFGPVGELRSTGQSIVGVIENLGLMMGVDGAKGLKKEIASVVTKEGTPMSALIPEIYDPNLSEVESLWGYLTYAYASAASGQDGRSLSDVDVQNARRDLGKPRGIEGAPALRTKLLAALNTINTNDEINRKALSGEALDTPMPDPESQAKPGSSKASPIQVTSEAEADALPPGTWVSMSAGPGKPPRIGQVQ
jgi:hypothetical protein